MSHDRGLTSTLITFPNVFLLQGNVLLILDGYDTRRLVVNWSILERELDRQSVGCEINFLLLLSVYLTLG